MVATDDIGERLTGRHVRAHWQGSAPGEVHVVTEDGRVGAHGLGTAQRALASPYRPLVAPIERGVLEL